MSVDRPSPASSLLLRKREERKGPPKSLNGRPACLTLNPPGTRGPAGEIALPFPKTHFEAEHQGDRTQVQVTVSKGVIYDGPTEVVDPAQRVQATSLAKRV